MFDIGSSELLMIAIVAIVVIGPKDLPRALYKVGQILGKARAMSRHFRSGIDAMVREVELEEMEKKWTAENRRIMKQYPDQTSSADADAPHQPALPHAAEEDAGPEGEAVNQPLGIDREITPGIAANTGADSADIQGAAPSAPGASPSVPSVAIVSEDSISTGTDNNKPDGVDGGAITMKTGAAEAGKTA